MAFHVVNYEFSTTISIAYDNDGNVVVSATFK